MKIRRIPNLACFDLKKKGYIVKLLGISFIGVTLNHYEKTVVDSML
jgi:hypothetical protein